ncbi:energy transducer TonB [Dawidia soli]|uniref:Energy transducer TonB n=1 Tax=Dawidia soli TaxID=2782352 RepID=A0AAP2DBR7_9BACT|nr:energy transducer TonB [Dawidia soli]MBT1689103.1 energy transducer TonB [Dawidia soli]
MRTAFTVLFSFLVLTLALGQQPKKVVVKTEIPPIKETFYVLEGNTQQVPIKHGPYEKACNARWTGVTEKGHYENGKRAGIWEVKAKGQIIQRIDFSTDSILLEEPADVYDKFVPRDKVLILADGIKQKNTTGRAPLFLGGTRKILHYYVNTLRYPAEARRRGIEGTVWIRATVTKDGQLINEAIDQGIGGGAEEEALRIIKTFPDDWVPLKVNGQPVDAEILISVKFKLA